MIYLRAIISLALGMAFSFSVMAENQRPVELEIGETHTLDFEQKTQPGADKLDLDKNDELYFTISEIEVTRIAPDEDVVAYYQDKWDTKDLGSIVMAVDRLLALGKKIWEIVDAGRPVVNSDFMAPISVLPQTEDGPDVAFYQMSSWQAPKVRTYKVSYRNGFGSNVISFDYTVAMQHGGQYEGKGSYLTGVDVTATNISVSWGFELDANSSLHSISNRGSMDDPIAAATLHIDYTASSVLRTISTSERFHVTGAGEVLHLR